MKLLKQKASLKPLVNRPDALNPNSPLLPIPCKLSPDLQTRNSPKAESRRKRFNYLSLDPTESLSPHQDSSRIRLAGKSPLLYSSYGIKSDPGFKIMPSFNNGIEQLETWLEKMKETHVPELDSIIRKNLVPKSEITKKVEDIYSIALNEIIKQIAGNNRMRAELLEKVLSTLRYVWNKYPQHLNFLLDKEKEFFERSTQELEAKYLGKIEKYKQRARVSMIKVKKLEEDKEMIMKEIMILRKSTTDYRTEVSQLVKYTIKPTESIGIQVDDQNDWLKKSIHKSITRYNSMKEYGSKIQLRPFNLESSKFDNKPMTQDKLSSEILKVFGNAELSPEFDLDALVDTVFHQTSNFLDWLSGFRLGFNLSGKVSIKTKSLLLPKFNEKLEISTITNKSSKGRSPRSDLSEIVSAGVIMKSILNKKEEILQTYAKNTQKKILKHVIKSIYLSFGKKFTESFNMADLVLQELVNRYNIKKIAEKKLKELLVGCILNSVDNLRIRMFACALGCGSYYGFGNYSIEGSGFYVKLYENMITSKTGIVLDPSEPMNIELYPLSRANETMKNLFTRLFPFDLLNSLFMAVKKISETDPSHINKEGVVKLDLFVDTCMNFYENFRKSITRGVAFAVKSITELNYLNSGEANVLIKHLAPDKKELIKELFNDSHEVDCKIFEFFCINNGILSEEEVMKFFVNCEKDWKKIELEVAGFESNLDKVCAWSQDGIKQEEWKGMFEDMHFGIKGKRNERMIYLWHMMKKEILDLKSLNKG